MTPNNTARLPIESGPFLFGKLQNTMKKVRPAAPVAAWMGGKKHLHRDIIEIINLIPHKTYAEPFVGMGGVFLRRSWKPKLEVVNDYNGEIINLFRVMQRHYAYFLNFMRFDVVSRDAFEKLRKTPAETLTDLQRAARFLYLQRLAFGGQVGGVFGVAPTSGPRFSVSKLEPLLEAAHSRLDGVVFENLDWAEILQRYDSAETLFYLDPPYYGNETDYGKDMFTRADFDKMADILGKIRGEFILSINDTPEVRDIFAGFHLKEVKLTYTISKGPATKANELIITRKEWRYGLL